MTVAVVGAGIAGAACAAALRAGGVDVEVFERGRAPGGRLASPVLHGRPVDLGAAGVRPAYDDEVSRLQDVGHGAVVLAMPDPQAARLLGDGVEWGAYEPVISVAAGWSRRHWAQLDAMFVNGDPDVTLIADDGARRGDGAPVLVAHSSADRARRDLDAPEDAAPAVLAAVRRILDVDTDPDWTHAHRWTFAKPAGTHGDAPFGVVEQDGRTVGICGDSWCPSGSPRVESAWLSGTRLGEHLAARLSA